MEHSGKARKTCGILIFSMILTALAPFKAFAVSEGTYLVTVTPSYKDPETGKIEDPGNNEAIGQGMTERMCGSTGLLEVDSSGTMYLTVRYYLSEFIKDVTFEERSGGFFGSLSHEAVQTKGAVEGAADIEEKYGYTDYRMPITSLDSVYRGKAFIIPAGRSVVYFFTVKNPAAGSGDFRTLGTSETKGREKKGAKVSEQPGEEAIEDLIHEEGGAEEEDYEIEEMEAMGGSVDDPVTGIPQKPSKKVEPTEKKETSLSLVTPYDLSKVPMKEARKQTEPLIRKATGIVKITGEKQTEELAVKPMGSNKKIMLGLFFVSAVLGVYTGVGAIKRQQGEKRHEK